MGSKQKKKSPVADEDAGNWVVQLEMFVDLCCWHVLGNLSYPRPSASCSLALVEAARASLITIKLLALERAFVPLHHFCVSGHLCSLVVLILATLPGSWSQKR